MEELRSTDVLDKEIQDDARKKAEKILSNAEVQCNEILSDVDARIAASKTERESYYSQKINLYQKDLDSSLPLEKSRFLVSYISSSVADGINAYLKTVPQEKRFELVASMFNRFEKIAEGKTFDALVYGFDADSVKVQLETKLKIKLNSCSKTDFAKSGEALVDGIDIHEGVILVSDDKAVKIRLTIEEMISELIDKYRNELAVTLFGGRLPE